MKQRTRQIIALAACVAIIAVACISALSYGGATGQARAIPQETSGSDDAVRTLEAPGAPLEQLTRTTAVQEESVFLTDPVTDVITDTGLYPAQEAALEIADYDTAHASDVPDTAPAAPAAAQPAPYVPPVTITENQQENCVGDGLTY